MKGNWLCMIMFVFILVIVGLYFYRMSKYNERIEKRDDKIELLEVSNDSISKQIESLDKEYKSVQKEIEAYSDTIAILKRERTIMKVRYEKQISDITAIPVDSVYREVTRWLDER